MTSLDNHFIVDYDYYNNNLKQYYINRGFDGKNLCQFLLRLPIYIPVPEKSIISVELKEKVACNFLFYSVNLPDILFTSASSADTLTYKKMYTVVEMIYITEEKLETDDKDLNIIFDDLMKKLNELILAIIIETKNYKLYQINTRMLEPTIIFRHIRLDSGENLSNGIFLLNHKVPVDKAIISEEQASRIIWFSQNVISKKINPFITSEELMLSSFRQKDNGFYKEAIMLAQSSVESFLRTLYKCILKDEDKTDYEIEKIMEEKPFMSIVKKEISSRIGGNWNPEAYGAIGNWYKETYKVRNKVAHGGLNPNLSETESAINRANELRLYVIQLIKSKSKGYPNIVVYFDRPKNGK